MSSDYPAGRGRVRIEVAGLDIEGVSIAGHESFYKVPAFRALLDVGRAPDDTLSYSTVCLTHGHLDHAAGLAHFASRRRLTGLGPARVFAPEDALEDIGCWIRASERLEAVSYELELVPAVPGERVRLRNDLELWFLPGRHRVPMRGYLFVEVRRKLREEFAGRTGEEIAALRASGVEVARREEIPLLGYPGDCGPDIFEAAPELFRARILLIECSFFAAEDVERAHAYGHLHANDFLAVADRFENEAIVLTHFSLRYRPEEIRAYLAGLPEALARRVVPFLPPVPPPASGL